MAEARKDGDEEFPNVSITRRGSTGRTIITVTITSVTDVRFCSFTSQDCYVLRLFEILAWFKDFADSGQKCHHYFRK